MQLLKYGPKTPSPLAKSLNTYREDVHRTLNSLIAKGMVRPSLDGHAVYAAVDLDNALEVVLEEQAGELREMRERKQELHELLTEQHLQPSDDVSSFKVLRSTKELVTATMMLVASAKEGFVYVAPPATLLITSLFGVNARAKKLIELGGNVQGIADIGYADIALAQEALDIREDLRHYPHYGGIYFAVVDKKHSVSTTNLDITRISPNESISMISDDPTYAESLSSTFEVLWERSVPAAERIHELLKRGPLQA